MNQQNVFQTPDSVAALKRLMEERDVDTLLSFLRSQLEIGDDCRFHIDSLVRLLDVYQSWRPRPSQVGLQVESMAVAWADTAFLNGRAAIWALENGMNPVGAACARTALEHGLYVSVLANEGNPESLMDAREAKSLRDFDLAIKDAGLVEVLALGGPP